MFSKVFIASAVAAIASAATIQVDVSNNNDVNNFSPNSIRAAVGDQIVFQFHSSNRAVAQGSFSNPCVYSSGGFFSGYPNPPSTFTVTVQNTDPIFYFDPFQGHCQGGAAGVINPVSGQTIGDYQSRASSVQTSVGGSGNQAVGGTLGQGDANRYSSASVYTPGSSGSGSSSGTPSASGSSSSSASSRSSASSSASANSQTASVSSRASSAVASASSAVSSVLSSATRNAAAATGFPAAVVIAAGIAAVL